MFFLGQMSAAPTVAQVTADIIGLLTGTITTAAGVSASFTQTNMKLVTTVAPGYTNFDPAAAAAANGVTPVVIASPVSDDATKKKFVFLDVKNAGLISFRGYETWNATTHAGTNPHALPTASLSSVGVAAGYWMVISASANHLIVMVFPNSAFANAPQYWMMSEYTRDDPWNTVANGYPSWFSCYCFATTAQATANTGLSHSRLLNSSAASGTATDTVSINQTTSGGLALLVGYATLAFANPTTGQGGGLEFVGLNSAAALTNGANPDKSIGYLLNPIRMVSNSITYGAQMFGSVSAKSPYFYGFRTVWASGDEFDNAGQRYFVANVGNTTSSIAIKEI